MNHQMIFKKLALSAVLVSAVAVPTVTNAASEPKAVSPEASSKTVTTVSGNKVLATVTTVASSWANPLELVKTYAPTTLEDWKKTLEQYKKVAGNDLSGIYKATKVVSAEPAVSGEAMPFFIDMKKIDIKPGQAFDITSLESAGVEHIAAIPTAIGEANNMSVTLVMDNGKADQAAFEKTSFVKSTMATSSEQMSEGDQAFFKAQIALNDAAKSKDAAAIKEALAKLLVQYKQQIADFETAK
ncbi:hypothetical protein [Paenibacillus glacialis]|uniref:Uncharacterized protein n=1 Tax=Paenibacillus glacialis TaxID=494026 RepID=A0A168KN03_9BACL|nr:hypothetical protein [Paenibacillus glacialis]OAB42240.1 hypothetical protein PGLA_13110 [Paenibacillus glacialis]